MTDTPNQLPPIPDGYSLEGAAPQQASAPQLPPIPDGYSLEGSVATPPSTEPAAQPGAFQTAPNAPVHNINNEGVQSVAQQLQWEKQNPNAAPNRERQFHAATTTPEQRFQRAEATAPVAQRLAEPVTTNDVMSQEYQKNHPIQAGLTDLATGMLTPKNLTIMAATEGLGTLAGPESVAASRVARALSAYFTADQIHGIIKESPEAWKAFKQGDESTALRLATHIVGTAGFGALSAQHAAGVEAAPATRFGEKADQIVDNISNRVKQATRSDQRAMEVANSRHQSAMVEHAQRQREADIAPGQAIDARQNAEKLQSAYDKGQPVTVDRNNTQLHQELADHFGDKQASYEDLEQTLRDQVDAKQRTLQAPTPEETDLLGKIQAQDQADAQRPPVTKKQVDDANTLASKAAANSRKATQALMDSHEALDSAASEVDRMSRNIEESQSGVSSVTKTVLKKLGLGGLNAEESMVKAGRPTVGADQKFREGLKTAAPALLEATDGVKVKTVGQFEDLLHDTANGIREKVFNPRIQKYGEETSDASPIGDSIRGAITDQMREYAPHDAEELEEFAKKFNKNTTLKKDEADLQFFNAELKKFYRMNSVDQSAALKTSGTVAKYEAAADGLRDKIYSKLKEKTGSEQTQQAQAQYGALKDLERTFAKRATVADRQAPISLHQILAYGGGLAESIGAVALGHPLVALAGAAPIALSLTAKHVNSPEYLIRNGLKQMKAEMDARNSVPPPPSREFSPLHSELATTYGEDVRDTSYQELESRLAEDMKAIRSKMRRGVALDTVENNKLAQYGQINAQNAADQIASQKDAEKLAEEKEKLPQPNLPMGAEPLMEIPSTRLDPKFDTQKAIVHDVAHHVVGDQMGLEFVDGIRSHEHPTNQNSGALMSAPIDWTPFLDKDGKVDPGALKGKIDAIVATYVAGGVANDLYHGISFDENPHLGADMDILKSFLKKRGFNDAEVSKAIAQGVDDAAKVLSQPGFQEVIEQHASVREPGLSNKYQMSPERMEQIKNDLRGGYSDEPTTGKSGAVPREGQQRPSGNGPGREGNTEGQPAGETKQAASKAEENKAAGTTGGAEPARTPDTIGKVPEENKPLIRPEGGWNQKEEPPEVPPFGARVIRGETALPHEYKFHVEDNDGNETEHTIEAHSRQQAMDDLHDTLEPGSWSQIRTSKEAPQRTPNTKYEVPTKKLMKMPYGTKLTMGPNGFETVPKPDIETSKHELGHVLGGHVNDISFDSIVSHRYPEVGKQNGRAAAIMNNDSFKDANGKFTRESFGNRFPKFVESLMGGIAADELHNGYPRELNMMRGGRGDVQRAQQLGKTLGLTPDQTATVINNAIDSVKAKLAHPVTSQILQENAGFREPNLSKAYHMSEERISNIKAEHDRRMREYEQANGNTGVGATEQRLGAGNPGQQVGAGGPTEGAVPTVGSESTGGREAEQAAEVRGLREKSTGDESADAAIKQGGGIPAGVMFPGTDLAIKMFHDPENGSTTGFKPGETISAESVKKKLADNRAAYQAKSEAPLADEHDRLVEKYTKLGYPRDEAFKQANQDMAAKRFPEAPQLGAHVPPEQTTGKYDEDIRKGGAVPGGIQQGDPEYDEPDMALFHDPLTGSTLALPVGSITSASIADELAKSRKQFGVTAPELTPDTAQKIADLHKQNGGSTYNLTHGNLAGTDNYAVAAHPERGKVLEHEPTAEDIQRFAGDNKDLLVNPEKSIGTWHDTSNNTHALDVVHTIPSRDEAVALGKQNDQKAIFGLKNNEEIPTGGTGAAPTVTKSSTPITDALRAQNKLPEGKTFDPTQNHFIAPDGDRIQVGDHDTALRQAGGVADAKKRVIEKEGLVRAGTRLTRQGNTAFFSVPSDGVTPSQIERMKDVVRSIGRNGNIDLERADISANTKDDLARTKNFATANDVEPMLREIGAHPESTPEAPKLGPKGSTVPLMKNPLNIKGTAENDRVNTLDVAKALNQFTKKKIGSLELGDNDPKMIERAKKLAEDEAKYQLGTANSGKAWYTTDIKTHDDVLRGLRPELQDPAKLSIFKMAEAVLSSGQKPYGNFKSAIKAWDHYNETGEFPPTNPDTGKSWGPRGAAGYGNALQMINRLVKEKGEQGASDWLLSDHSVKELRDYNKSVSGKQDDNQLGAMILGPKRGPFAQNLHGIESAFTADMWVSRTWNRWMGTLDTKPGPDGDVSTDAPKNLQERKLMERSFSETADKLGLSTSSLQAVLWYYEQGLYDVHGAKKESWSFADAAKRVEKEHNEQKPEETKFGFGENKPEENPNVQAFLEMARSLKK